MSVTGNTSLVQVRDLKMWFPIRRGILQRHVADVKAVDGLVDQLCHAVRRLLPLELEALLPAHAGYLPRLFPVLGQIGALADRARQTAALPDLSHRRPLPL